MPSNFSRSYLTYSRGSLVGLAAGLLVIGVLRYRKLLMLGVVGAVLLLLLPQAQAYVTHLVEGLQLQDRATLMRLGEYKDALALISRYPWFGVGFAGSPDADLYVGVSNLYLLMAEIMGVLGVAAFLIVIVTYLANLLQGWRRVAPSAAIQAVGTPDAPVEALLAGPVGRRDRRAGRRHLRPLPVQPGLSAHERPAVELHRARHGRRSRLLAATTRDRLPVDR